jgi:hypothetical protein
MSKRKFLEEETKEDLDKKKLKPQSKECYTEDDTQMECDEDDFDNELVSFEISPSDLTSATSSGITTTASSTFSASSSLPSLASRASLSSSNATTLPNTPLPFVPIEDTNNDFRGNPLYISPPSTGNSNNNVPDSAKSNSSHDSLEGLNFDTLILHEPLASISGRSVDFSSFYE